jgi:hypothetical protein
MEEMRYRPTCGMVPLAQELLLVVVVVLVLLILLVLV